MGDGCEIIWLLDGWMLGVGDSATPRVLTEESGEEAALTTVELSALPVCVSAPRSIRELNPFTLFLSTSTGRIADHA